MAFARKDRITAGVYRLTGNDTTAAGVEASLLMDQPQIWQEIQNSPHAFHGSSGFSTSDREVRFSREAVLLERFGVPWKAAIVETCPAE